MQGKVNKLKYAFQNYNTLYIQWYNESNKTWDLHRWESLDCIKIHKIKEKIKKGNA